MAYNNDAREKRTGHKDGGSHGKQGGHGTGKVKCSAEGGKSGAPKFKPASEVVGAPIVGEHDVPGLGLVKGSSSVQVGGINKGKPGSPERGGKVQKPKGAVDSGY